MTSDISKRQRADDEPHRRLVSTERSADFIAITDAQGQSLFVNPAGRLRIGPDRMFDSRAATLPDLFVSEERVVIAGVVLPAVMREGRWLGELTCRHVITRTAIPVLADLFRIDDPTTGQRLNVAVIARDLTDRTRAEAHLQQNEDTFAALIRDDPFGVDVVDADLRVRQVGAGALPVFEHAHSLLGRDLAETLRGVWPEPFASDAMARFRHTLAFGEPYAAPHSTGRRHDNGETDAYE